eukprot:CFRG1067T1
MSDRNRGNQKLKQARQARGNGKNYGGKGMYSGYDGMSIDDQKSSAQKEIAMDEKFNFVRLSNTGQSPPHTGWLINMHTTTVFDEGSNKALSALDMYFIRENGSRFKSTMTYSPYFYVAVVDGMEREVETWLKKKFSTIKQIHIVQKEDLDLDNHLIGITRSLLKIDFLHTQDLMKVRRSIMPAIKKNQEEAKTKSIYSIIKEDDMSTRTHTRDYLEFLIDIREYDVPYHIRTAIDNSITCGLWYDVRVFGQSTTLTPRPDLEERPDPVVMAFDIECTKQDLKFPDADNGDMVMMISYMLDNQGYLIINRDIVSADIEDFEYTPKPDFEGPFIVWNEPNEQAVLQRFFDHIVEVQPTVIVTFNGDFFDWPFIDKRAKHLGIDMYTETGFAKDSSDEYKSRHCIHMDAFRWVMRDSYLPQGSQGLKAVTKAKLGYDPLELDPELMCRMARENPQLLANYSVSDAVATYYLYMKYVHPFIFSLCTIIPMEPDEVLRKGSGTLCETLLMVESFNGNIIFPNKQTTPLTRFYDGKLLESETYVGGHVEALEAGVFRSDIPLDFKMVPSAFKELREEVEQAFRYTLEKEMGADPDSFTNMDELVSKCVDQLKSLELTPTRKENPMIYHLDVSAMYPNIILTNRLQPSALVNESTCAVCDFNKPGANCQRKMEWVWRGDYIPASKQDYYQIKQQCEHELFPPLEPGQPMRKFHDLDPPTQAATIKKRLQDYSKAAYKKTKVTTEVVKESTVCMRENSFYIDTVRAFRDRRYIYKGKNKEWGGRLVQAKKDKDPIEITKAKNMCILYDSLQLAHKCILNSFYGYVMRRGARWFSMEMAGIVCYTGSNIITRAREIVEKIGIPLELDTDGIWCVLPSSFPEDFVFQPNDRSKKKVTVSYPGAMLNLMVHKQFTNHQYQDIVSNGKLQYETKSENSIFFEVDGPYRAMILPSSTEEDKLLKKRYAVFNPDGSLAELKGFELKRRGELQLIKSFQGELFAKFLEGDGLDGCYKSVAAVANHWLDVLYSKGRDLLDEELFDLISENRSLSRSLDDYGDQKSVPISAAKRLGDFLGPDMIKGKGLACKLIISEKPIGAPVTERAVPILIFKADESIKRHFLRKWLKEPGLMDCDPRNIIDWSYYINRFGAVIQKIITIPAAFQQVDNPVPRVKHPDWLRKRVRERLDTFKQKKINSFFGLLTPDEKARQEKERELQAKVVDIEDFGDATKPTYKGGKVGVSTKIGRKRNKENDESQYQKHWSEVFGEAPDKQEDFQAWVDHMKKRWAFQKEQRKRRRMGLLDGGIGGTTSRAGKGLSGDLFKSTRIRSLRSTNWHVLQLIPMPDLPGVFKMWCILHDHMRSFTLTVPRVFYVNTRNEDNSRKWPKVTRTLPRGRPCLHLYEFSQSEARYQRMFHDVKLVAELMSHPDVEGVYETKVPLDYRALMELGCVVQLNQYSRHANTDTDFDLSELEVKRDRNIVQAQYLQPGTFDHIYFYHCGTDRRGVFGLFFSATNKATIIVVDSVINNQLTNVRRIYESARSTREEELRQWAERSSAENQEVLEINHLLPLSYAFEVKHVLPGRQLHKAIQSVISGHVEEVHQVGAMRPTLLLSQSSMHISALAAEVPLLNDFPCLTMLFNPKQNEFPPLQWQISAVRNMFVTSVFKEAWLDTQLEHARYGQIPVGNLPADVTSFVADVEFSRQLAHRGFVQWVSKSDRPDLGGREADDNTIMSELETSAGFSVNNEGMYHSVCVELKVESLAVNAVLRLADLNVAEGVTDVGGFDANANQAANDWMEGKIRAKTSLVDESVAAGPAFKALTELVNSWFNQVHQYQDRIADQLLMRFYRWLCSRESLTYDPAIHLLVQSLIKKVFVQLLAEFKTKGAAIVYASLDKLVISTNKNTPEDAKAYVDFVLGSIRHQDAFNILEITPVAMYEQLMWKGPSNYGCMRVGQHILNPKAASHSRTNVNVDGDGDGGMVKEENNEQSSEIDTQDLNTQALETEFLPMSAPEIISTQDLEAHVLDESMNTYVDVKPNSYRDNDSREIISGVERDASTQDMSGDESDQQVQRGRHHRALPLNESEDDMTLDSDVDLDLNDAEGPFSPRSGNESDSVNVDSSYESHTSDGHIVMKWNMSHYLPEQVQTTFNLLVGTYIVKLYRFRESKRERQAQEGITPTPYNVTSARVAAGQENDDVRVSKELIQNIQEQLFEDIPKIQRDTQMAFPNLPGSHLDLTSPALSLVNFIMAVLKLDKRVNAQVSKCRKNLLRLLHVGEFGKAAVFEDPCLTFVLPEVICNFCMECRDIDLCRDMEVEDNTGFWHCPACTTEYNKDMIEHALIDVVKKKQIAFCLQDLVCDKCNSIQRMLTPSCPCSGVYRNRINKKDMQTTLQTLTSIATFYKLNLLLDTLQYTSDGLVERTAATA